jgi:two-component system LytT family sensor kinase
LRLLPLEKQKNLRRKAFLYHLLFWAGIYLLWVLVFRSYSFSITKTMTIEFCYLIFVTADYYAVNNLIVPQFLLKKKYALFAASTIVVITVSAWLRALVAVQMNLHFFHAPATDFSTLYLNSVINISLWVLLVTIAKMLIDRIQTQQQLDLLEKERIKNELDYLKAQINPHALLNSLNTIYGHIDKSNQTARNVLLQFAELLKYQLYECGAEKVDVEKEMLYIQNYVAFQKLRKDEKLVVDFEARDIGAGLKIAPLLLVVLIENAFKFVSSFSEKENNINIRIFTKEDTLHCSVANTKEVHQSFTEKSGGIGLVNLKRRLELLYNQKYTIHVNDGPELYEANLIIDLA